MSSLGREWERYASSSDPVNRRPALDMSSGWAVRSGRDLLAVANSQDIVIF